jgi:hypothetical protein
MGYVDVLGSLLKIPLFLLSVSTIERSADPENKYERQIVSHQ